ncbi:zinc-binding dehydrogenase [Salinarchaeum sp. Harcht-Bsk1]|uniref:NADPH:quinone reductase n=1 Tax=Salinarchaeum sp. Harcht-Bsk1 TaxID=1333523 RepID=UPI00034228B3|nr:NADPH:quinone reductase [Salinarchaeum sp. Harcht-Bsk1]AGN00391.1 zinc-binding dehydrogenase [Salinarchaeum sp. Harcht-Bsk1]
MQAVRYHEHGDASVLQVDEVSDPSPDADEVVLSVAAAGVNPVDTYFREGSYEPFTLPMIPGVDAAGVVESVGDDVDGFDVGDRAIATGLGSAHLGGYAERVAVPTDRVAHLSDGVDLVEAGAAGVAAVTAWRALIDHAGLQPTEHCLIHGGSGGVGHAAVQIAKAAGATVVTTAAPRYHARLESLGSDVVLDYDRTDLADAVRDASDGGVDVTLDHRLDDYLQFDADVAAHEGRVVGIGENDPVVGFENDSPARGKDLRFQFMSMFNTPRLAEPLERVATLLDDGALSVEVEQTYSLENAAAAQTSVMTDSFLGKLAITP